jgi:hypothetical protein
MTEKKVILIKTEKSMGIAYILYFFLTGISAHRFYLNRIGSAIFQIFLFAFGWAGILVGSIIQINSYSSNFSGLQAFGTISIIIWAFWILVDLFLTAKMTNEENEKIKQSMEE